MSSGWRLSAVAAPILALVPAHLAVAADAPAEKEPTAATTSAPRPAAEPPPSTSWTSDLLGSLRDFGVESWWDVARFARWTGSLGVTLDSQQQRLTSPRSPTERSRSDLASETAAIRNDGFFVLDPRLFRGTLAVGFTLDQQRQQADTGSSSQHGTLTNYAFDGTLLPETAYNANVFAVRTQSTYVLPSGSTTRSDNQREGVALHLRENSLLRHKELLPYFSANLTAQQQQTRQTTTTGGQSFRQDDQRDQLAFDFHNGGLTSDLNFQYQLNRLENRVYAPGSYESQSANLVYSLDFGPTLNRRWDSRINYYSRVGQTSLSDLDSLEVNEFLTIDHNVDRSSTYNYQLTRQATPFGTSTTHVGVVQVNQQVYANLSASGGVNGTHSTLPGGSITAAGGSANLNYSRRVAWEGHLTASAGGSNLVTATHVAGGAVEVRDAPYAVPQVTGAGSRIVLADRNIVAESLVVVVLKGGTRVLAVPNADYSVRIDGDRTSIVPLPSSALMFPGDPLNVSYVYNVAPDSRFRTTSRSFSFGIDWPLLGFSFSHDESDQKELGGGDNSLLFNQRRDAGTVYVTGAWEEVRGRASLSVIDFSSTRLAYLETRADQYLTYQPYLNLQFGLAANQYRTEYERPVHTTTGTSIRLDVTWTWRSNWLTSAYAGTRSYRDSEQPSEKIDEAGFRLRRTWTLLDVNIFAGTQRRKRGDVSSMNQFVHFGAVRRF